ISLFMMGGPSQMDLFDPKPMLTKYDGQKFPGEIKYDNLAQASAKVFGSPFKFSPHGQCGMELSELLPCLGQVADDITLIRATDPHILNLDPPPALAGEPQRRQLDLLKSINEEHLAAHPGELDLQARIASYELAAKMQTAAKEALDISNEPEHIKKLYGV